MAERRAVRRSGIPLQSAFPRFRLAAHSPSWMTPRRLKAATAAILAIGVLAAGSNFALNGSNAGAKAAMPASASAQR